MSINSDSASRGNPESLIHKAAQFSRVVTLIADDSLWWMEKQMLQLRSLPCMQHVTALTLEKSSRWVDSPPVQAALLGLPRLKAFDMAIDWPTRLLPSAVALASKLSSISVQVVSERCPKRALRALRLAPALTSLTFGFCEEDAPLPLELVWSLPPTLTELKLWNVAVSRSLSRPLLKTLFSHTPQLSSVQLRSVSLEAIFRGLLDAGIAALPSLGDVTFERVRPVDLSVDIHPDPLEPIFRRFVRRFPQVNVRIDFADDAWDDEPDELHAVQMRYVGWSAIAMYSSDALGRVGGPRSPHTSDDDLGSEVEDLKDVEDPEPLADEFGDLGSDTYSDFAL